MLLIVSCQHQVKDQKMLKEINSFVESKLSAQQISNFEYIIFAPIKGCSDCIDPIVKLAKKAVEQSLYEVVFVFSDFSRKDLMIRFSREEVESNVIILDNRNEAFLAGIISTSPLFCTLQNSFFVKQEIVTPENMKKISSIIIKSDQTIKEAI